VDDEEIIKLIQKGEAARYGEIIDRYQKKLARYIKELVNQDEMTVEDLVEETLIKGYINIQGFDHRKKFSSWIYRIGHNLAVDFMKKKRNMRLYDWAEEVYQDKTESDENKEINRDENERLMGAINRMENKYKEVLWLYYFEDKSYDEISDILEKSTNYVGVILSRAKEKLKKDAELFNYWKKNEK
jgi:RNA polymerase sigma-70 factor (ECF subfamily)